MQHGSVFLSLSRRLPAIIFFTGFLFGRCWVSVAAGSFLSLQRVGSTLWLRCTGCSLQELLLLQSTDSRVFRLQWLWHTGPMVAAPRLWSTGSVVMAHRLTCSAVHGIFLDQGLNPYLLHWQADSLPLSHQRSLIWDFYDIPLL